MNSLTQFQNNDDKSFKKALENAANPQPHLSQRKKNTRRKHRNSHLGCGTCKKRRIKCDENLPLCLNCLKGKLHCAYLNLDSTARNALRMAQYNQNVRLDSLNEVSNSIASGLSQSSNNHTSTRPDDILPHQHAQPQAPNLFAAARYQHMANPNLPHVLVSPNTNAPQPQAASNQRASLSPAQNGSSTQPSPPTAHACQPPQPIPHPQQVPQSHSAPAATAQLIQSPYGPMVSIQPYAVGPMGNVVYSNMQAMPVQVQTMPQMVQVPLPFLQSNGMISNVGGPMPQPVQPTQISVQPGQLPPQMMAGLSQLPMSQGIQMPMLAPVTRTQTIKPGPKSESIPPPVPKSPRENDANASAPEQSSFTTINQVDGACKGSTHMPKNVMIKAEDASGLNVKLAPLAASEDKIDKVPTISKLLS